MMPTLKKRNPQDATLRNIRPLKRRVEELESRVEALEQEKPNERAVEDHPIAVTYDE